jgi:uncharacterized protein (DUF305 family)
MTLKRHTAISIGILIIGITFGYLLSSLSSNKETYRPQAQVQNNSMHGEMNNMMKGLEGKTGDEFDKAFLKEMIVHHEGAVKMAESALQNAENVAIKGLAQNIINSQTVEIAEMNLWLIEWYGQH